MLVAVLALVMAMGGGAYAAGNLINGSQIKKGTVAASKLSSSARRQLEGDRGAQGETGAAGPQGPKGDTGASGPQGPKGDPGAQGLAGEKGDTGAAGESGQGGAAGPEGPAGPAGQTGLAGSAGAAGPAGPVGPAGPTEHNYGVAALFLNGNKVADVWSPTIPMDDNNAAMASGSTVVECTVAEAPCAISVRGVVRSGDAGFSGQAGAGVVVTNAMTGVLAEAGQTPANATYGGVKVVDVGTVGLGSGSPTGPTDGTAVPVTFSGSGELPAGLYVVQGTVEFFDFS
jgi:Collagen triple helix repeat (20 copies)